MRNSLSLFTVFTIASALAGCAGSPGDEGATSDSAMTLNPAQCQQPSTGTTPRLDASGAPIAGTARTTLNGCHVVQGSETPQALLARALKVLRTTSKVSTLRDDDGVAFFSRVTLGTRSETAQAVMQDTEVVLGWDSSPAGKLRFTTSTPTPDTVVFGISTTGPFKTAGATPTTVISGPPAGGLTLNVRLRLESNGISVVGTSDVTLLAEQQRASDTSMIARHFFEWLVGGLNAPVTTDAPDSPDT